MSNLAKHLALTKDDIYVILPFNNKNEQLFTKYGANVVTYGKNDSTTLSRHADFIFKEEEMGKMSLNGTFGAMNRIKHFISWMFLWGEEGDSLFVNKIFINKLKKLNFDIAVADFNPFTKYYYALFYKLGIPYISITNAFDPSLNGIPAPYSFVPIQLYRHSDKMEFKRRFLQVTMIIIGQILKPIFPLASDSFVAKYCEEKPQVSLDTLIRRSSLWIYDLHPVLEYPRPSLPHTIFVGALTIQNAQTLPDGKIKSFIDGANDGIIVVAMGTYIKYLPRESTVKFVEAFRRLKERVIWRFTEPLADVSENILTVPWLPQNDLLGHPKTKLFITHCGNNGQYEAVYHGVPMIGFPLFLDQFYNAHRLVTKGYGLEMDLHNFSSDELYSNIIKIITNTSFSEKLARASAILKDDGLPVEKASFWIRHVTRFGSEHLRSSGIELPWYTFWCVDTLGFLILLCIIFMFICCKSCFKRTV